MRILHLSDIHFGVKTPHGGGSSTSAHYFATRRAPDPSKLSEILNRDSMCNNLDAIIISGDVGWSGVDDDYRYAAIFFAALREARPRVPLVIPPGNHDVNRDPNLADDDRQNAFIRLLQDIYGRDFKRHYPLFGLSGGPLSKRQQIVSITAMQDTLVVAVNSAAALTTASTPVYVAPDVLASIQDRIASMGVSDEALRIFVVHHHLFPFAEPTWDTAVETDEVPDKPDPTIVANSAKLQAWLADNSFHLVLHGHKHMSHGRDDVLWREGDPSEGRRLLVIGAGSAGVAADERGHDEPLSYNVITATRIAQRGWDVVVAVRKIDDKKGVQAATESYGYRSQLGQATAGVPVVFAAASMDECHRAIATSVPHHKPIHNFLSVVEDHTYVWPPSIRIGDHSASDAEVRSSFQALHPEWDPGSGWNDAGRVARELRNVTSRFQFEHGPRLFGVFGRAGAQLRGTEANGQLQPLRHAVDSLSGSSTRAYAGLYNAEIDVASGQQPLPGLMSVQFVPDGHYLDVVATFRKLELSFWWGVNMLEIGELLRWAAKQGKHNSRTPRRITFFAAIAEWKHDPEATFVTDLDRAPLAVLVELVTEAHSGRMEPRSRLAAMLRDKIARTNDRNIDYTGLQRLVDVVAGVINARGGRSRTAKACPITAEFRDALKQAMEQTVVALEDEGKRVDALERAERFLRAAADRLAPIAADGA